MEKNFFTRTVDIGAAVVRIALFFGNVAALGALGVKTVKLWTGKTFDLLETMKAFPTESEFADFSAAERQMWYGAGFETFVFIIGGFLCYELFVKPKSIRLRLVAPLVTAFLVLTGESVNLFLPALDKVHEIETCQAEGIPWSARRHECDYMELERRRMEKMLAAKKPAKARKKAVKLAVSAEQKTAVKPAPKKTASVLVPAAKAPVPKQDKTAAKPAKSEAKPAAKPAVETAPAPAPAAKQKPKRKPVKKPAPKPAVKPAEQTPPAAPAKKLAPPKSLAP